MAFNKLSSISRFFELMRLAGYAGRCSIEAYTKDFVADAWQALRIMRREIEGVHQ
jgi:hypothetical protein